MANNQNNASCRRAAEQAAAALRRLEKALNFIRNEKEPEICMVALNIMNAIADTRRAQKILRKAAKQIENF